MFELTFILLYCKCESSTHHDCVGCLATIWKLLTRENIYFFFAESSKGTFLRYFYYSSFAFRRVLLHVNLIEISSFYKLDQVIAFLLCYFSPRGARTSVHLQCVGARARTC